MTSRDLVGDKFQPLLPLIGNLTTQCLGRNGSGVFLFSVVWLAEYWSIIKCFCMCNESARMTVLGRLYDARPVHQFGRQNLDSADRLPLPHLPFRLPCGGSTILPIPVWQKAFVIINQFLSTYCQKNIKVIIRIKYQFRPTLWLWTGRGNILTAYCVGLVEEKGQGRYILQMILLHIRRSGRYA